MFRCIVTNADGALLVSKPATLKHTTIQITSLSPDWWGPETGTAEFTVVAETTSSSLTYLWKWYNDGTWTNSAAAGATTNTIRVGASGDNWTTYRCWITDAEGNTVISDSVTIHTDSFGFTKQPEDCYCSPSGNATFSVETYGTNLTYQWQWHSPSSKTWTNSAAAGANTNAISLGVSGDNGTVYRCVITDANGKSLASESATVIPYAINWEYQYNADGIRIYRSNGATTYRYIYNDDQLSQMEITEEATGQKNLLTFSYDAAGLPMTADYNGATYYFVTNLQGDVIAITDDSGNVKVEYTYDAWGNPLAVSGSMASTLGKHNPLRYRSYVYDAETNLYYLQSRYYDPEVGRFVNADDYISTGQGLLGYNMFGYCLNNPVCGVDMYGYISVKAAKKIIKRNAGAIKKAGKEFGVDPVTIAGCIYAEQVLNVDWKDTLFDLSLSFLNTSVGIGQIKVSTAIMVQKLGYIKRNPRVWYFSMGRPVYYPLSYELLDNKTNIRYVAAYLKAWQNIWSSKLDISNKPGILATLYNLGKNANLPNYKPKTNRFGKFVEKNYKMLKGLLGL